MEWHVKTKNRDGSTDHRSPVEQAEAINARKQGAPCPDRALQKVDLRSLTKRERQVFEMKFDEGLTQQEIADKLGISQPRVCQILQGALRKIRRDTV